MLYYINADLIEEIKLQKKTQTITNKCLLIHGCNCFCTFGAGFAFQLKKAFPRAYNEDLKTKRGDISKLGSFTSFQLNNIITIINAYTQYGYGKDKKTIAYNIKPQLKIIDKNFPQEQQFIYGAFINILLTLNEKFPDSEYDFRLPKIGSGLAGGDWDIIEDIIIKLNPNRDIYIYSL